MFGGPPYTKHPYEVDGMWWYLTTPPDPDGRDLSHHGGSIRIEDEPQPQRLIGPAKEER